MSSSNYIQNVAVVGAGGHVGSFITDALLKTGKHNVTAITRIDSQSKLPEGVIVKKVDYNHSSTVIEALKGQDALVITISGRGGKGVQEKIVDAAAEAGVPWVMPNEWAPDTAHEGLIKDVSVFQSQGLIRERIAQLGKSSYIALSTGFWYEWSIAIPPAFGFDLINRKATLFDDGETKISTSTWPQVGRVVAGLLSLPVKPEGGNPDKCLENFRNKHVYVSSFVVNQKDMLESALRVTGTKEADWTITKEPSKQRYEDGLEAIKTGDHIGFAKMMYTRVFYPDGSGNFDKTRGTVNELLGLPKENIDEATKVGIERASIDPWA